DFAPLWNIGDAAARPLAGTEPRDISAIEHDAAFADRLLPGQRIEEARLADAVATQHAGHFARFGRERYRAQRLRGAVMEIDGIHPQHAASSPQIDFHDPLVLRDLI